MPKLLLFLVFCLNGRSMASKFAKTVCLELSSLIPHKTLLSIYLTSQSSSYLCLSFLSSEPPLLLTLNHLLSVHDLSNSSFVLIHYRFYQLPVLASHPEHLFVCLISVQLTKKVIG